MMKKLPKNFFELGDTLWHEKFVKAPGLCGD